MFNAISAFVTDLLGHILLAWITSDVVLYLIAFIFVGMMIRYLIQFLKS